MKNITYVKKNNWTEKQTNMYMSLSKILFKQVKPNTKKQISLCTHVPSK